jgi:hypothetical protein
MSTFTTIISGIASLLVLYIATRSIYTYRYKYREGEFSDESIAKFGMVEYSIYKHAKNKLIKKYIHISDLKYEVRINDEILSVDYSRLLKMREENTIIKSRFYDLFTLIFLQDYFRTLLFIEEYQSRFSFRYYFILIFDIAPFLIQKKNRLILHPAYFYWGEKNSVIVKWLIAVKTQNEDYLKKNTFLNEVIDFLIFENVSLTVDRIEKSLPYLMENKHASKEDRIALRSIFKKESATTIENSMYGFLKKFKDTEGYYFRRDYISKIFLNQ